MFTIKQPDQFGLMTAEKINNVSADMLQTLKNATITTFRELFYDYEEVRPKEDIRRILAAFERPADLFEKHAATVTFLLTQAPGILAPEEYTPPVAYVVNADGSVTIPD